MAVVSKQQLEYASVDADTLAAVINGPANPGTVVNRLGGTIQTLAKVMYDLAHASTGAITATAFWVARLTTDTGTQDMIAGLGVAKVMPLEYFAKSAGINLGSSDDTAAFAAATTYMNANPGTYVFVSPGRYKLQRLRFGNKSGFFCTPKTVMLEMVVSNPAAPEVFVSLSDMAATYWLFWGFTLYGGWNYNQRGFTGATQENDPYLSKPGTSDPANPDTGAQIGQRALQLHTYFNSDVPGGTPADTLFRNNSGVLNTQNPRGRVGELDIISFGGDGMSIRGSGAQIFGAISIFRSGGRNFVGNSYDIKLGFLDWGDSGLENAYFGPFMSADAVLALKGWYAAGRNLASYRAAIYMDRCNGMTAIMEGQDPKGGALVMNACVGCQIIMRSGHQGTIADQEADIAMLEMRAACTSNQITFSGQRGDPSTHTTVVKLLRMVTVSGARPKFNQLFLQQVGLGSDTGIWNPAWFEGTLDDNFIMFRDVIRVPKFWRATDNGAGTFGVPMSNAFVGHECRGPDHAFPGGLIALHQDAFSVQHYNAGAYTASLTAFLTYIALNVPMRHKSYTVGTLPSASAMGAGAELYVNNMTGGQQLAYSDGTNWRRVSDLTVAS